MKLPSLSQGSGGRLGDFLSICGRVSEPSWIHRCRERVVERSRDGCPARVQQREFLGMRVVIADQCVEDHVVEQTQHLRRTRAREPAYQREALRHIWSAFILVFHFRHYPLYPAEILLMKAPPVPLRICDPVVAFNRQERTIQDGLND